MNTFGYVGGNPLGRIDPSGLDSCYAIGQKIVCVTGQRPPPEEGTPIDGPLSPVGVAKTVIEAALGLCTLGESKVATTALDFVEHGAERALERGFSLDRILQVLREGQAIEATGRYGSQTRYILGDNIVIISNEGRNAGKIVTVYSNQTVNGVKGYWVDP